jgi:hypothetical protein
VSLGSCFAVNIGQKLDYFKFRNTVNPFGILFHPAAIEKFIGFAVNNKQFTEADIFFHNERWHSFDAHSDLSHTEKGVLLKRLNDAVKITSTKLAEATHIIITLGTAWVYRKIESNMVVANCHKVPQKQFIKELLPANLIKESLQNSIALLKNINKSIHITFTISPVRHIKDGFTENQWSKSNLITALHETLKENSNCSYFPSYEIMMDELRDYRFYAEDMIHPNKTAIEYIWERFTQAAIAPKAYQTMKQADTIQKGLQHRPFNPDSAGHAEFMAKINTEIASIKDKYPHITF